MEYLWLYDGPNVKLSEILKMREKRVCKQAALLSSEQGVLISFTLNISGPVKIFTFAKKAFAEGIKAVKKGLDKEKLHIVNEEWREAVTGCEAFILVQGEPEKVKKIMIGIEESHPLGRIFDIDVIGQNGHKIERRMLGYPERSCILCTEQAHICARSRRHSLDEIRSKTAEILYCYFKEKESVFISEQAEKALISEVNITPKPGLVDQKNCGAHKDMDIGLFMKSIAVLKPWFKTFAELGMDGALEDINWEMFVRLRKLGIEAEKAMFTATGGVNTHKGIIFSMAFICASLGRMFVQGQKCLPETLSKECAMFAKYSMGDFETIQKESTGTNGEKIYVAYGIKGARKEAAEGFPTVLNTSLPVLRKEKSKGRNLNKAAMVALIAIMSEAYDTNIIARSDIETAKIIKEDMKKLLIMSESKDITDEVRKLDKRFTADGISPGGSADLLAVTLMFDLCTY